MNDSDHINNLYREINDLKEVVAFLTEILYDNEIITKKDLTKKMEKYMSDELHYPIAIL